MVLFRLFHLAINDSESCQFHYEYSTYPQWCAIDTVATAYLFAYYTVYLHTIIGLMVHFYVGISHCSKDGEMVIISWDFTSSINSLITIKYFKCILQDLIEKDLLLTYFLKIFSFSLYFPIIFLLISHKEKYETD